MSQQPTRHVLIALFATQEQAGQLLRRYRRTIGIRALIITIDTHGQLRYSSAIQPQAIFLAGLVGLLVGGLMGYYFSVAPPTMAIIVATAVMTGLWFNLQRKKQKVAPFSEETDPLLYHIHRLLPPNSSALIINGRWAKLDPLQTTLETNGAIRLIAAPEEEIIPLLQREQLS
jgi:hypothetical protein